jgi:hypothetical protein
MALFMGVYYQQIVIECNRCVNAWRVVIRIFTVVNVTFRILGKHLNQHYSIHCLSVLMSSSQISCSANKPTKSPTLVCKAISSVKLGSR